MSKETKTPEERMVTQAKLQTGLLACILAVLIAAGAFAAVKVVPIVEKLEQVDVQQVNSTVESFRTAVDKVAQVDVKSINDSIRSFSQAAEHMEELDIDTLNSFLESLNSVAEKMDRASEGFKNLFGR